MGNPICSIFLVYKSFEQIENCVLEHAEHLNTNNYDDICVLFYLRYILWVGYTTGVGREQSVGRGGTEIRKGRRGKS